MTPVEEPRPKVNERCVVVRTRRETLEYADEPCQDCWTRRGYRAYVKFLIACFAMLLLVEGCGNRAFGAQPRELVGHVVKVYDGDTITIETQRGDTERVRLVDIDAPELKQAHGVEARDALAELLELDGGAVVVKYSGRDKYGRLLGTVTVDDTDANVWQVNHGHAWAWRERGKLTSDVLGKEEAAAKADKRGLWETERPLPPWEYRARKRAQQR